MRAPTATGSPSIQRSTSTSWIECSISVPPPAVRDIACARSNRRGPGSGSTGRRASTVASGAAVARRTRRARPRCGTPAPTAARGRPGAGLVRGSVATRRGRREVGRERLLAEDRHGPRRPPPRPLRGGRRSTCTPTPTSTASSSSSSVARRLATVVARRPCAARSGSVVERRGQRRVDQPGLGELLQRVPRARCRCARSRRDRSGSSRPAASPVDERRRTDRAVRRTGRAPRRPRARPRRAARSRRRCVASSASSSNIETRSGPSAACVELRQRDAEQAHAAGDVELRRAARVRCRAPRVLTSVGSGSVRARVRVSKSPKRIFNVTVRAT